MNLKAIYKAGIASTFLAAAPVFANTGISDETVYLFNTLFLLVCAVLVMFMAAGFAMLEAGMVRSKSVAVICTKNIALYALAGVAFYFVGYELMYGLSFKGLVGEWVPWLIDDRAALAGDLSAGHASGAGWFFQMVFVATAASVVSGALAERVRFWPFVVFTLLLTGVLYPVGDLRDNRSRSRVTGTEQVCTRTSRPHTRVIRTLESTQFTLPLRLCPTSMNCIFATMVTGSMNV